MAPEGKTKLGKAEIQFYAPAHTSSIKNSQAIEKTTHYLNELKITEPNAYKNCQFVPSKGDKAGNTYELKENGEVKGTITHDPNGGSLVATFKSTEPKHFHLALYYAEHCKPDKAQLTGKLEEPHPFRSTLFKFNAGEEVKQEVVLTLYEKARIEGFATQVPESEATHLFGQEGTESFEKYKTIKAMKVEDLKNIRTEQEYKHLVDWESAKLILAQTPTISTSLKASE